jgi:hypothetical protein
MQTMDLSAKKFEEEMKIKSPLEKQFTKKKICNKWECNF